MSERANIDEDELDELREQAQIFLGMSEKILDLAVAADELMEVSYADETERQK